MSTFGERYSGLYSEVLSVSGRPVSFSLSADFGRRARIASLAPSNGDHTSNTQVNPADLPRELLNLHGPRTAEHPDTSLQNSA